MSRQRRLFNYLLINIFVSACVTGTILFWYDRNYRAILAPPPPPATVVGGAAAPPVILPAEQDVPVEIVSVVGAGTLEAEVVVVRYNGETQLDMLNWQLKDDDGNIFTFPQLTLYTNGAVQVHTAAGTNTVVDLYWDLRDPIWQSGEVAELYDPGNNLRALYRVP